MKTVKISLQLFIDLVRYHLLDFYDVEASIKKELEKKMEAYKKRALYTKYKTAETEKERELARNEYLELIGLNDDFRW
ncbi:MAG: complexin-2 [Eubacterium sp.]|nr:complexin-2 [Eubacterium sp.]